MNFSNLFHTFGAELLESVTPQQLNQWRFNLQTLPFSKTNNEFTPENGWLEDDPASFWGMVYFKGRHVGFEGVYVNNIFAHSSTHEIVRWNVMTCHRSMHVILVVV